MKAVAAISAIATRLVAALNYQSRAKYRIDFSRVGPKTHKTGKTYPHSSARQQARYARQIAA